MIDLNPDRPPVTPREAATVLLARDEEEGFSIFMVRRHAKSGFMAGAYVFPGGTLDDEDQAPALLDRVEGCSAAGAAAALGEANGQLALGLYVAALRETFEEAGILLADGVDPGELAAGRTRLHEGAAFLDIVRELDLRLRADALVPFSRWVTPVAEKRRYDARFFLARAPRKQRAEHDRIEVTAGEWLTPGAALDACERGRITLFPPTLRTLEQLVAFDSLDAAIADVRGRVPRPVMPVLRPHGDTIALTLPGDPEHPESEVILPGPSRFVLADGRFRSSHAPENVSPTR
ncbi:MAG: NUDIX hydrolase [Sandaracinaceae bacterium]